ncbi:hypothetical protein SAMD00019534_026790, partial [Acytostelium subglobosum LB1]|uniref:hypothetical protein n=1 Tax=Acytostelium subglobosum LB1 TaxID=1410327 RepID=UPI000644BC74
MNLLILFVLFVSIFGHSLGYGESDPDGNPIWRERESHVITNTIRMAPQDFVPMYYPSHVASNFMQYVIYPPVGPLYLTLNGSRVAKAHSVDLGTNGCFEHNDCNGTLVSRRFNKFLNYYCLDNWSENMAQRIEDGKYATFGLLCETTSTCFPDLQNDGHRSTMMNPDFNSMGVGMMYGPDVYTQDFFQDRCLTLDYPVHSGSHTYNISSSSSQVITLYYLATWHHNTSAPTSAKLFVKPNNGSSWVSDLKLQLGKSNAGTYFYKTESFQECQQYYFVFELGSKTYRYPETGVLQTLTLDNQECPSWVNTNFIVDTDHPSSAPSIPRSHSIIILVILIILTILVI